MLKTMSHKIKTSIISTGSYLPENQLNNEDLKQFPPDVRELIEIKTGVKTRRFAHKDELTSDLAIKAARDCLGKIKFNPKSIDAIILATSSPDRIQPATATRVQYEIGAEKAFAFDINSVCSGAIYGIYLTDAMIKSEGCKYVLLIASEIYSKFLNPKDFSTYPYFGDGAGAILFGRDKSAFGIVICSLIKTDGSGADIIQIPAGGTKLPFYEVKNQKDIFFHMKGKEVYSFAVNKATEIINEIIDLVRIERSNIKLVIPHQANINIIKEISFRTGINFEKFIINLDKYGNTAAASILIGLDEAINSTEFNEGDLILTVGFGGGLSWGVNLISVNKKW